MKKLLKSSSSNISLCFVGDMFLDSRNKNTLGKEIPQLFRQSDFVIGNCESSLTNADEGNDNRIRLISDPKVADIFSSWGVNIVSLANNHSFDDGEKGHDSTTKALERNNITHIGTGADELTAFTPIIIESPTNKIALIACSSPNIGSRMAGPSRYGCANLHSNQLFDLIYQLKTDNHTVIIMPHWGLCDYIMPTPSQINYAHKLSQLGADAVIGCHSHTVQGLEKINKTIIAYSLGNFSFSEYLHNGRVVKQTRENKNGIVLRLEINAKSMNYKVLHTENKDGEIQISFDKIRRTQFVKRCNLLSGSVNRKWQQVVFKRLIGRILFWMKPRMWSHLNRSHIRGIKIIVHELLQSRQARK